MSEAEEWEERERTVAIRQQEREGEEGRQNMIT